VIALLTVHFFHRCSNGMNDENRDAVNTHKRSLMALHQ